MNLQDIVMEQFEIVVTGSILMILLWMRKQIKTAIERAAKYVFENVILKNHDDDITLTVKDGISYSMKKVMDELNVSSCGLYKVNYNKRFSTLLFLPPEHAENANDAENVDMSSYDEFFEDLKKDKMIYIPQFHKKDDYQNYTSWLSNFGLTGILSLLVGCTSKGDIIYYSIGFRENQTPVLSSKEFEFIKNTLLKNTSAIKSIWRR